MSNSPAYHLRPNKAVERLLFLELLRKLDGHLPVPMAEYRYVGLGGPYLEDFSLLHSTFATRSMTSLEVEQHTVTRQEINMPASCITLTLDSTGDFAKQYTRGRKPVLIWYDYSKPNWKAQLTESCELLQKLPPFSIFKVTLAGVTHALGATPAMKLARLNETFADYGPFSQADVSRNNICATLYRIYRAAIGQAVPDTKMRVLRSLASFEYDDGTPILTVTAIVGPLEQVAQMIATAELVDWPFADLDWGRPKKISIPQLSLREKLSVDRLLPDSTARTVVNKLKLRLGKNYQDSVERMDRYVQFYRHVPQFLRIAL